MKIDAERKTVIYDIESIRRIADGMAYLKFLISDNPDAKICFNGIVEELRIQLPHKEFK